MRTRLAITLILLATPALAEPVPESHPGPKQHHRSGPAPVFHAPELVAEPLGARYTVVVPPGPDLPRGGLYTDNGVTRPGGLTDAEREKFLAAYGPIARVLGLSQPPREAVGPAEPDVISGVAPFLPAAVGPDLPVVQVQGPRGLTPDETRKRDEILARQAEEAR
jgi:hypothetical protein